VLDLCSGVVGSSVQIGYNLDCPEQRVQVDFHMAQVQVEAEIWRRFGGGSDRNRARLGKKGTSMHDMQSVQSRINTAYFASC
jgi:hypothetical protein